MKASNLPKESMYSLNSLIGTEKFFYSKRKNDQLNFVYFSFSLKMSHVFLIIQFSGGPCLAQAQPDKPRSDSSIPRYTAR